jgi:DNA-binding MarR family transcriptional regulator
VVSKEASAASLTEAVLTASRALVAVAARSLAAAADDVTLPQYRALVVLAARGRVRVGDLAEALGVHPSTATRLCDRLVDRRLVRRAVDRTNRRETTITLSPKGRALVDAVTDVRRAEIRTIVERIPRNSRATAVAALRTFADAAGEPPPEAWTLGWT